jgi:hypothetical protein
MQLRPPGKCGNGPGQKGKNLAGNRETAVGFAHRMPRGGTNALRPSESLNEGTADVGIPKPLLLHADEVIE